MAPPQGKKRSAGASSPAKSKKPRTETPAERKEPRAAPSFKSALQSEEVDFPRGGGSSLTAFETKQIRAEGQREADAEAQGDKKKKRQLSERHAKKLKKNEKEAARAEARAERDKDTIRVEELSYKRLVAGTMVLGRVHTILPLHLVLSLPNNLLGHVPITEVSTTLTTALNAEMDSDAEDKEEDEDEEKSAPELVDIFTPGQYVAAKVLNLFPTASQNFIAQYPVSETTKLAARVELTLVPEKLNSEVAKADLAAGFRITGEVLSDEDKGYRVGLGLNSDAGAVEGFITSSEVDEFVSCEYQSTFSTNDSQIPHSRTAHHHRRQDCHCWRPCSSALPRPPDPHSFRPHRSQHRLSSPRYSGVCAHHCRRPIWIERQDLRLL